MLKESGANVIAFDTQDERMADELTGDDDLVLHAGDVSCAAACADVAAVALERFAALDALIHWGRRIRRRAS